MTDRKRRRERQTESEIDRQKRLEREWKEGEHVVTET